MRYRLLFLLARDGMDQSIDIWLGDFISFEIIMSAIG